MISWRSFLLLLLYGFLADGFSQRTLLLLLWSLMVVIVVQISAFHLSRWKGSLTRSQWIKVDRRRRIRRRRVLVGDRVVNRVPRRVVVVINGFMLLIIIVMNHIERGWLIVVVVIVVVVVRFELVCKIGSTGRWLSCAIATRLVTSCVVTTVVGVIVLRTVQLAGGARRRRWQYRFRPDVMVVKVIGRWRPAAAQHRDDYQRVAHHHHHRCSAVCRPAGATDAPPPPSTTKQNYRNEITSTND